MYTGWKPRLDLLRVRGVGRTCAGFIGQLLVLLGTFAAAQQDTLLMRETLGASLRPLITLGCIAAAAIVLTAGYLLWTLQRVYMGDAEAVEYHNFPGLYEFGEMDPGTDAGRRGHCAGNHAHADPRTDPPRDRRRDAIDDPLM